MAVNLTFDAALSRVRISATSLLSGVDTIRVERSINQITWTLVRGGAAVPVSSGAAALDDYEFVPGVANFYRVSQVDAAAITYVGAGAAVTGNNATLNPGLHANAAEGDTALVLASIRNSGTGTVNVPAGWTLLAQSGNLALLGRRLPAGPSGPTVTFAGGVANADTLAQAAVFRNMELVPETSAQQLNGSAQNIAYPALDVQGDGRMVLLAGWKQDDWTSVATLGGNTEIGEPVSTAGDDAGQVWDFAVQTGEFDVPPASFTVTGGASAISRAMVVAFTRAAWRKQETNSITPAQDTVWIKSITRPFLNRAVVVGDYSDIERPARTGVFPVIGRTMPVAVTDVRLSRRWTMTLHAATPSEADAIDLVFASGDPLYIQVPADCDIPGGYVVVGDVTQSRRSRTGPRRYFAVPCTEVAAPAADVVGATVTCAAIVADFATCADLVVAFATCADVLEYVASPDVVIVP